MVTDVDRLFECDDGDGDGDVDVDVDRYGDGVDVECWTRCRCCRKKDPVLLSYIVWMSLSLAVPSFSLGLLLRVPSSLSIASMICTTVNSPSLSLSFSFSLLVLVLIFLNVIKIKTVSPDIDLSTTF